MNSYFDQLGSRFAEAAHARGATIQTPTVTSRVAQEILELARVAAHTQERRFAPIASFVAGLAVERMRREGVLPSDEGIAGVIREVRSALEAEAEAAGSPPEARSGGQ